MSTSFHNWQMWHKDLISFVNGDFSSLSRRLATEILSKRVFHAVAKDLTDHIKAVESSQADTSLKTSDLNKKVTHTVLPARFNAPSMIALKNWINQKLRDELYAFILHGSVGTDEIINYSDCDALIIINNEVFADPKRLAHVGHSLFKARKFTYKLDPLQHHGWFVLPEWALSDWPQSYLPHETLPFASQISSDNPLSLSLKPKSDLHGSSQQLLDLMSNIESNIRSGQLYQNLYRFKSFISTVLLLPAFYVQYRDQKGVFKRESFELAKVDFAPDIWHAIERASDIRLNWPKISPTFPAILSTRPGLLGDGLRKRASHPLPTSLKARYGVAELNALSELIEHIRSQINRKT